MAAPDSPCCATAFASERPPSGTGEFQGPGADILPGLLASDTTGEVSGTLHLHATDGQTEWWIDLDAAGSAVSGHVKAGTAIRGTRSDLLLWLTNRSSPGSMEVFGRRELLDSWKQLRR
jgi:hypothetical protein